MEVNEDFVKHIAKVARLELSEEEVKSFVPQLKEILEMFSVIDECDVENVQPSFQPISGEGKLREDIVGECLLQEDVLSLTPHKKDSYFKGPRII